jgi:hypothetical protein
MQVADAKATWLLLKCWVQNDGVEHEAALNSCLMALS